MNGIHVELVDIRDRDTVPLGEVGITVAAAAGPRQVQRIHPRIQMSPRQDIVAPVAVGAGRGVSIPFRVRFPVNAPRVFPGNRRMACGALNRLQFRGMGDLGDIAVARRAFQRTMD